MGQQRPLPPPQALPGSEKAVGVKGFIGCGGYSLGFRVQGLEFGV